jgi:hypothetical protein
MNRNVLAVRFWLICILGMALALYSVEASYCALAMAGFGNFPGCGPCCVTCNGCSGTPSETYQIDVAGVANGFCTNCSAFNTSYVLPLKTVGSTCNPGATSASLCAWAYTNSHVCTGTCTTINYELHHFVDVSAGNTRVRGVLNYCDSSAATCTGQRNFFSKTFAGLQDCAAWVSESITKTQDPFEFVNSCTPCSDTGSGAVCNGTAATWAVTSL